MPYVTLEQYVEYAEARGITVIYDTIDGDLYKSADFVDTYYTFKGEPLQTTEQLPTDKVTIDNVLKGLIKSVELQQAGRLKLDTATMVGGLIESESKSLDGVGSKSVSYVSGSQSTYKPRSPELDLLFRPWLANAGSGLRKS